MISNPEEEEEEGPYLENHCEICEEYESECTCLDDDDPDDEECIVCGEDLEDCDCDEDDFPVFASE